MLYSEVPNISVKTVEPAANMTPDQRPVRPNAQRYSTFTVQFITVHSCNFFEVILVNGSKHFVYKLHFIVFSGRLLIKFQICNLYYISKSIPSLFSKALLKLINF